MTWRLSSHHISYSKSYSSRNAPYSIFATATGASSCSPCRSGMYSSAKGVGLICRQTAVWFAWFAALLLWIKKNPFWLILLHDVCLSVCVHITNMFAGVAGATACFGIECEPGTIGYTGRPYMTPDLTERYFADYLCCEIELAI